MDRVGECLITRSLFPPRKSRIHAGFARRRRVVLCSGRAAPRCPRGARGIRYRRRAALRAARRRSAAAPSLFDARARALCRVRQLLPRAACRRVQAPGRRAGARACQGRGGDRAGGRRGARRAVHVRGVRAAACTLETSESRQTRRSVRARATRRTRRGLQRRVSASPVTLAAQPASRGFTQEHRGRDRARGLADDAALCANLENEKERAESTATSEEQRGERREQVRGHERRKARRGGRVKHVGGFALLFFTAQTPGGAC